MLLVVALSAAAAAVGSLSAVADAASEDGACQVAPLKEREAGARLGRAGVEQRRHPLLGGSGPLAGDDFDMTGPAAGATYPSVAAPAVRREAMPVAATDDAPPLTRWLARMLDLPPPAAPVR